MGRAPLPQTSVRLVLEQAAAYVGIDANLVKAVAWVESSWRPRAKSDAGACGLMQLMPAVCTDEGVIDPFDPMQCAIGGARHLKALVKRFGDLRLALAAYNWGPGNVQHKHMEQGGAIPGSVHQYVDHVLARLELERTSVGAGAQTVPCCELCGRPVEQCSPGAPRREGEP